MVFHPESLLSLVWDSMVMILLLYATIETPIRIAFLFDLTPGFTLFWIDFFVDLLFCLDILKRFMTGYYVDDFSSDIVMLPKRVAKRYLKTWFLLDFLSCVPMDVVISLPMSSNSNEYAAHPTGFLTVFRFAKLLKLLRLFRDGRLAKVCEKKLGLYISPIVKQMGRLIFVILASCHLISCGWFYLVNHDYRLHAETNAESFLTGMTWVGQYLSGFVSEVEMAHLMSLPYLYGTSFYWASSTLTSVGFGDVVAFNSQERIYASLVSFMGSFLTGYIISSTTSMLMRANKTSASYREQMDKIKAYLGYRKVPMKLSRRIIEYFTYYISRHALFDEQKILQQLSLPLRVELTSFLFEDVLKVIPMFASIKDSSFLSHLMMLLKPVSAAPGDVIIKENDIGLEMYFVVKGVLVGSKADDLGYRENITSGNHFGETSLFNSITETTGKPPRRQMTVTATSYCDLFSLSKHDFTALIKDFPEVKKHLNLARSNASEEVPKKFESCQENPCPDRTKLSEGSYVKKQHIEDLCKLYQGTLVLVEEQEKKIEELMAVLERRKS